MERDPPEFAEYDMVQLTKPVDIEMHDGDRNTVFTIPANYTGEIVGEAVPNMMRGGYVYSVRFSVPFGAVTLQAEGSLAHVTMALTATCVEEYDLEFA